MADGPYNFNMAVNAQLNPASIPKLKSDMTNAVKGINIPVNAEISAKTSASLNTFMTQMKDVRDSSEKMRKSIYDSEDAVESFGKQMGFALRRFTAFSLVAGTIISSVVAIKNAVHEAIAFEKELMKVQQVTGASNNQIEQLKEKITSLAKGLGVSSRELVDVSIKLGQAGVAGDKLAQSLDAIAEASLSATFRDISETGETAILLMKQFNIEASSLENSFGSLNAVASKFGVQATEIGDALKTSGTAFRVAGGDLNEFVAIVAAVKNSTRESAQSIGSALHVILSRLEKPEIISELHRLGIEMRYTREEAFSLGKSDLEGKFVGPYEAIKRLSGALAGLNGADSRFNSIARLVGGFREIQKLIPLVENGSAAQEAYNVALAGQASLTRNASLAQDTYANKLQKVKEELLDLGRNIIEAPGFKGLADMLFKLVGLATMVVNALKPIVPILALEGISRLFTSGAATRSFSGFSQGIGTKRAFATGGYVSGQGNGDKIDAKLEPGEFVLSKRAVEAIGLNNLSNANRKARGYSTGMDEREYKEFLNKGAFYEMPDNQRKRIFEYYKAYQRKDVYPQLAGVTDEERLKKAISAGSLAHEFDIKRIKKNPNVLHTGKNLEELMRITPKPPEDDYEKATGHKRPSWDKRVFTPQQIKDMQEVSGGVTPPPTPPPTVPPVPIQTPIKPPEAKIAPPLATIVPPTALPVASIAPPTGIPVGIPEATAIHPYQLQTPKGTISGGQYVPNKTDIVNSILDANNSKERIGAFGLSESHFSPYNEKMQQLKETMAMQYQFKSGAYNPTPVNVPIQAFDPERNDWNRANMMPMGGVNPLNVYGVQPSGFEKLQKQRVAPLTTEEHYLSGAHSKIYPEAQMELLRVQQGGMADKEAEAYQNEVLRKSDAEKALQAKQARAEHNAARGIKGIRYRRGDSVRNFEINKHEYLENREYDAEYGLEFNKDGSINNRSFKNARLPMSEHKIDTLNFSDSELGASTRSKFDINSIHDVARGDFERLALKRTGVDATRISALTQGALHQEIENKTIEKLAQAEARFIKALDVTITKQEAYNKGLESAREAYKRNEKVILDAHGNYIATQKTAEKAHLAGIDIAAGGKYALPGIGQQGFFSKFTGLKGIGERLTSTNLLFAGSIGANILADQVSSHSGTAVDAVTAGRTGGYRATKAVGGAISSAAGLGIVGASIGGAISGSPWGGPIGAAVGAVVGAGFAIATSLNETAKEIADIKLANTLSELNAKAQGILSGELSTAGISSLQELTNSSVSQVRSKSLSGATGFFGGFDANAFSELQRKGLRENIGPSLPVIAQVINKQAAELGKKNPGADSSDLFKKLIEQDNGFAGDNIGLLSKVNGVPKEVFEKSFLKVIQGSQVSEVAKQMSKATNAIVISLDRLASNLEAAAFSVGGLVTSFNTMEHSLSGGSGSQHVTSLSGQFSNLTTLDKDTLTESIDFVSRNFGSEGAKFSKDAFAATDVASTLTDILPSILANTEALNPEQSSKKLSDALYAILGPKLNDNPQIDKFITLATNEFREKEPKGLLNDTGGNIDKIIQELLKKGLEPIQKFGTEAAKKLEANANLFIDQLNRYNALTQKRNDEIDKVSQVRLTGQRFAADVEARRSGRTHSAFDLLSLGQLEAPFRDQQTFLAGGNAFNAEGIGTRLGEVQKEIKDKEQERQAALASGDNAAFMKSAEALADLEIESNNLNKALRNLADITGRNANIQDKLNKLQEERSGRQGFAEGYLTADPEARQRLNNGILGAARANQAGDISVLSQEELRNAIGALNSLGNIKLQGFGFNGVRASEVKEKLLNSFLGGNGLSAGDAAEEKGLQDAGLENVKQGNAAQKAIVNNQGNFLTDLRTTLVKIQEDFFAKLAASNVQAAANAANGLQVGNLQDAAQKKKADDAAKLLGGLGIKSDADIQGLLANKSNISMIGDKLSKINNLNVGANDSKKIFDEVFGGGKGDLKNDSLASLQSKLENRFGDPKLAAKIVEDFQNPVGGGGSFRERFSRRINSNVKAKQVELQEQLKFPDGTSLTSEQQEALLQHIKSGGNVNDLLGGAEAIKKVKGFAAGGFARGSDNIPAVLSQGEFVVNKDSARANASLLKHINAKKGLQYMEDGGFMGPVRNPFEGQPILKQQMDAVPVNFGSDVDRVRRKLLTADAAGILQARKIAVERRLNKGLVGPQNQANNDPVQDTINALAKADSIGPSAMLLDYERNSKIGGANYAGSLASNKLLKGIGNNLLQQQLLSQTIGGFFGMNKAGLAEQTSLSIGGLAAKARYNTRDAMAIGSSDEKRIGLGESIRRARERLNSPQKIGIQKFAQGGVVPGVGNSDSVLSLLTPGETVIPKGGGPNGGSSNNGFQQFGQSVTQFGTHVTVLDSSFGKFGTFVEKLSSTFEKFPSKLVIEGSNRLEVVVNGAEVFARIQPELQNYVKDEVQNRLQKFFKDKLPDA